LRRGSQVIIKNLNKIQEDRHKFPYDKIKTFHRKCVCNNCEETQINCIPSNGNENYDENTLNTQNDIISYKNNKNKIKNRENNKLESKEKDSSLPIIIEKRKIINKDVKDVNIKDNKKDFKR